MSTAAAPPAPARSWSDRVTLALAGLLAFASGADRVWFAWVDRAWLPWGDDAVLAGVARERLDLLSQGLLPALASPVASQTPYPPLVALTGAVTADVTGWGLRGLLASQAIWSWVGAGAAVWAGLAAAGPSGALLGAAVWIWLTQSALPGDQFFAEPAVGALALATVVLLERSAGLRRPGIAALAGLAAGLGLLAKFTFATFVGPVAALWVAGSVAAAASRGRGPGPVRGVAAVGLAVGWLASVGLAARWAATEQGWYELQGAAVITLVGMALAFRRPDLRVLASVVLFVVIAGGVASTWYLPNRVLLRTFLAHNQAREFVGEALPWPLAFRYCGRLLLRDTLDTPGLVLVAIGAIRAFVRPVPGAVIALLAAIAGVALLAAAPYQSQRYVSSTVALLVPVAIAAVPALLTPTVARLAAVASVGLLATRSPEVTQRVWGARPPDGERIHQEPTGDLTTVAKVEAFLARPWRPLPVQVRLRPPVATPSGLRQGFEGLAGVCPPDVHIRAVTSPKDAMMPFSALWRWEPHPEGTLGYVGGEDEVPVVVGLAPGERSAFHGRYVARTDGDDPRCP